ncbi:MAG: ABC transporter permease [Halobacteriales archaeon]|nr:ABC transporter permease [Halobacteriales archaeon]
MALAGYIARRLLLLVPVMLGVTLVTFSLTWVATQGDLSRGYVTLKMTDRQVEQLKHAKGFDQPFYIQYGNYLARLATGDLGVTKTAGFGERPINDVIAQRFPATIELTIVAMLFAVLIGIPLGTLSAIRRDKPLDHVSRIAALSGVSIPIFWLGLILKMTFATHTGISLFPLGGRYSTSLAFTHPVLFEPKPTGLLLVDTLLAGDVDAFGDAFLHIVLPGVTLGYATMAIITRMMRSSMLEVLRQDYVRTALAKGLPQRLVYKKHARANAMLPTVTVIGLAFGSLLGGAVLTETIFQWPGLGEWSTQAIASVDSNAVLSFTILVAIIYVVANLAVDIVYAYLDPRVRLG